MNATTIKLHKRTKSALDELRSENESYESVINKLIMQARNKNLKNELIAAYKQLGKEELDTLKEWEAASQEV